MHCSTLDTTSASDVLPMGQVKVFWSGELSWFTKTRIW